MTTFDTRPTGKTADAVISWSTPDTTVMVATVQGEYAGMIEFDNGHFTVRTRTNTVLATCSSIPAAQSVLAKHIRSQSLSAASRLFTALTTGSPRRPFLDRRLHPAYARGLHNT